MASRLNKWLELHAAAEKRLSKVIGKFFDAQTKRVTKALRGFDSITTAAVDKVFKVDDEHEILIAELAEPLLIVMAGGAVDVIRGATKKPRGKKDIDVSESLEDFDLPADVKDAIAAAFDDLMEQGYWKDIQSTTSGLITDTLTAALDEGLSEPNIIKALQESMAGVSKARAAAIARTESTAAFGAGHQAAYDGLAAAGDDVKKEWLAVVDNDTRQSHEDLDGKTVDHDKDFDVGGSAAPYPGHPSLPAEQRVNCRCTTAAVIE
jgi:SPP1 gp7 family putative phage head morphogenesis protein